jgi:uncharacterized membrane protein YccC
MANSAVPAGRLRRASAFLVAGYAALLVSFVIRHPVALTILIPLGGSCVALGVLLWLRAVVSEARAKGMV